MVERVSPPFPRLRGRAEVSRPRRLGPGSDLACPKRPALTRSLPLHPPHSMSGMLSEAPLSASTLLLGAAALLVAAFLKSYSDGRAIGTRRRDDLFFPLETTFLLGNLPVVMKNLTRVNDCEQPRLDVPVKVGPRGADRDRVQSSSSYR